MSTHVTCSVFRQFVLLIVFASMALFTACGDSGSTDTPVDGDVTDQDIMGDAELDTDEHGDAEPDMEDGDDETCVSPLLCPIEVDFGNVLLSQQACRDISIANTGDTSITITKVEVFGDAEEFTVLDGPCGTGNPLDAVRFSDIVIAAGESTTFGVQYTPADPGPDEVRLVVTTRDDPCDNSHSIALVSSCKGECQLTATPGLVDFGNLAADVEPQPQTVVLANECLSADDNVTLKIGDIRPEGSPKFSLNNCMSGDIPVQLLGLLLPPGEDVTCEVGFQGAMRSNVFDASFTIITTPQECQESRSTTVQTHAVVDSPMPVFMPSNNVVSFCYSGVGTTPPETRSLILKNNGTVAFTLQSVEVDPANAPFFITSGTTEDITLEPDEELTFGIAFEPQYESAFAASLLFTFDFRSAPYAVTLLGRSVEVCPDGFVSEGCDCIPSRCYPADRVVCDPEDADHRNRLTCNSTTGLYSVPATPCPEGQVCVDAPPPFGSAECRACEFEGQIECFGNQPRICRDFQFEDLPSCNDAVACTQDLCDATEPTGCAHVPVDSLCDDTNDCTEDVCDPSSDAADKCVHNDKADNTLCDDGLFCIVNTTCQSGRCVGETRDCNAVPDYAGCKTQVCNEALGQCTETQTNLPNGTPCDDGDEGTTEDQCTDGLCTGTPPASCSPDDGVCCISGQPVNEGQACADDGNDCTDDICSASGICIHPSKDDGIACGSEDQCFSGNCVDCTDVSGCGDLADDGLECSEQVCNLETNTCEHDLTAHSGELCADDNLTCTHDLCDDQGQCSHDTLEDNSCLIDATCYQAGEAQDVDYCVICDPAISTTAWTNADGTECAVSDDNNPCTDNVCQQGTCAYVNNDANACEDGLDCTATTCQSGSCVVSGATSGCLIDGACVDEGINQAFTGDGSCRICNVATATDAWTVLENGESCDDGDGNSSGEVCTTGGVCLGCIPNCDGKECGDDGCGNSCGSECDSNTECIGGQCLSHICIPPSPPTIEQYIISDEVIEDVETGLIWQKAHVSSYSWNDAVSYCNNLELAEKDDWRLPEPQELFSLFTEGTCNPALLSPPFTNEYSQFWTVAPYIADSQQAWRVQFDGCSHNTIWPDVKSSRFNVRCVRGIDNYPGWSSSSRYEIETPVENESIIIDKMSNLNWLTSHNKGTPSQGIAYCDALIYAGYSDWRMPNTKELLSIVDYYSYTSYFPIDSPFTWTWTIIPVPNSGNGYYHVSPGGGHVSFQASWEEDYICVRGITCECDCGSKVCGDDGCGGSCGECDEGFTCSANGQCVPPCTHPEVVENCSDGWCAIPAGCFWMGSPDGVNCPEGYPGDCTTELGRNDDEQLHAVHLTTPFSMMSHEVTQAEWQTAAQGKGWGENPSYFGPNGDGADCGDNCPVERVNWFEALEYANFLSEQAGLKPCYVLSNCTGTVGGGCAASEANCLTETYVCESVSLNGVDKPQECEGYRLPTEAEWEYAVKAGSNTALYQSDGNDGTVAGTEIDGNLDQIAWYSKNSNSQTNPVGLKAANAWGLLDMSGNIYEWIWNWKTDYPESFETDPTGPLSGTYKVLRGGTWHGNVEYCRSAARDVTTPDYRGSTPGFRLVKSCICGESQQCGDDGCGNSCGECGEGEYCASDQSCVLCGYEAVWDVLPGEQAAMDIIMDAAGDLVITGKAVGNDIDVLFMKLKSDGTLKWSESYGTAARELGWKIIQDDELNYIAVGSIGINNTDIQVTKISNDGNLLWQKSFGGPQEEDDNKFALTQISDGTYIIVGNTHSKGAGQSDVWVFNIDKSGNLIWDNTYGFGLNEYATDVIVNNLGNLAIPARTYNGNTFDFWFLELTTSGQVATSTVFENSGDISPKSIIQDANNNYLIGGGKGIGTYFDCYVMAFSPDGTILWDDNKQYGTAHNSIVDVEIDANDNFVAIADVSNGGTDTIHLLTYSIDGTLLDEASHSYNYPNEAIYASVIDNSNNIFTAGIKSSSQEVWVSKFTDACVCVPDCVAKQCGDDGCAGSCGECETGECIFETGQCVAAQNSLAEAIIGPEGGTIEVIDTQSPYFGSKVEIPESSLDSEVMISIFGDDNSNYQLPEGSVSAGVGLVLKPSQTVFSKPVRVSLPFNNYTENTALEVLHCNISGCSTVQPYDVNVNDNIVSVNVFHFSYLRAIRTSYPDSFDTSFRPNLNGFGCENVGCFLSTGGMCAAMAGMAKWYFLNQQGQLYNLVNQMDEQEKCVGDDKLMLCRAQDNYQNSLLGWWESIKDLFEGIVPCKLRMNNVRRKISESGQPMIIILTLEPVTVWKNLGQDNQAHALLVYRYDETHLFAYDPNNPGIEMPLECDSFFSFKPYLGWSDLDHFYTLDDDTVILESLAPDTVYRQYCDYDSDGIKKIQCGGADCYDCYSGTNIDNCNASYPPANQIPSSTEICGNNIDDNCNGSIDENCPVCISHSNYACYENDVYYYDSCGNLEDQKEECGQSAYTGSNYCSNDDVYRDYVTRGCSQSNCYATPSAQKQQECGMAGCSAGSCNTCASQSYSECFNGDRYWYDSCNNQESVRQYCNFPTPYCLAGEDVCVECLDSNNCPNGYSCSDYSCVPDPEEICNGVDDDGDGVIDELESCWKPVYRFWNNSPNILWVTFANRAYSNSTTPPSTASWFIIENTDPIFYLYAGDYWPGGGDIISQFWKQNTNQSSYDHFLTIKYSQEYNDWLGSGGYEYIGDLGYIAPCGTQPTGNYYKPVNAVTSNIREIQRWACSGVEIGYYSHFIGTTPDDPPTNACWTAESNFNGCYAWGSRL